MSRIVRGALVQATWTGDKESMIQKHEGHAHEAAKQGAQFILFQELFYGPYFCQVQDAQYYSYTELIPDGPTTKRMQALARETGLVVVAPMYEEDEKASGIYYNTAAVIDSDGTYLGKYRKTHIPHVKGFWEKFYFRPGNLGYPVFETAVGKVGVYIATTATSRRAPGRSASTAPRSCSSRAPRAAACRSTCGGSSRSATRSPTATTSGRSTGSAFSGAWDAVPVEQAASRKPAPTASARNVLDRFMSPPRIDPRWDRLLHTARPLPGPSGARSSATVRGHASRRATG